MEGAASNIKLFISGANDGQGRKRGRKRIRTPIIPISTHQYPRRLFLADFFVDSPKTLKNPIFRLETRLCVSLETDSLLWIWDNSHSVSFTSNNKWRIRRLSAAELNLSRTLLHHLYGMSVTGSLFFYLHLISAILSMKSSSCFDRLLFSRFLILKIFEWNEH